MTFDLAFDLQGENQGQRTGYRITTRNYVLDRISPTRPEKPRASKWSQTIASLPEQLTQS